MDRWTDFLRPVLAPEDGDGGSNGSGDGAGDGGQGDGGQQQDDPSKWDPERAKSTILAQREAEKKLKAELAEARKVRETLEKEKKEREDAELSEIERHKRAAEESNAKAADLEKKLKETELRYRVVGAASRLNIVDPEVVYLLIDKTDLDDDGKVEAALKELIKTKPYLVAPKADDKGRQGAPPTPKPDSKGGDADRQKEAQAASASAYRHGF